MKRFIRFLSLVLSVVMSLSLFAGCDCNGEKDADSSNANVITKVDNASKSELYNFEQWKPDFSCIKIQKLFGVVTRNKNKDYCKSGDYSAKLQPIGGHIEASTPVVWFPTFSETWDFDYRDFSNVDYVSVWMYNANDEDKTFTMGLVSRYTAFQNIRQLQGQTFLLKSKEWTLVKYVIDFGSMTIGSTVSRDDMINIQGIYMQFDTAVSDKVAEAPVYYADDISLIYKETVNGFESPLSFDANAEIKYLMNFDEIWHSNVPFVRVATAEPISAPTQMVVNGVDVGVSPTSGNRMAQLQFPLMKASDGYTEAWHRWLLPEQMMREFWKTYIYNPDAINPYVVPREEWKDWYFCYDVYNASAFTYNLTLKFYASGGNGGRWSNAGASKTINPEGTMNPGEWSTVRISVDTIASDLSGMSSWTNEKGVSLKPNEYYLNDDRITNPGALWITFNSAPTVKVNGVTVDNPNVTKNYTKMTYYFDSFRLVKMA